MGQVGLHGLTGLVVGEYLLSSYVTKPAARRGLLYGFALGNFLPDLDFLAVVAMYPQNHSLAMHLHRGFSHSLLAATALVVGFYAAGALMRDTYLRYLGYGLALGVVAHFTEDIFLWFAPVDIFWPASIFGYIPPVDLWWWWTTPPLLGRLLGAAEFAAFALYYDYLVRVAVAYGTNQDFAPTVRRMATTCWLVFAVLTALAVDLPNKTFEMALYVPMGIVFMPAVFYITWRMQATIEVLATGRKQPQL
ncbi:MAG TPA: metal-dependent hydrolase [Symbiobacteriaceae bacterium]|nr:metal-dependent hydrolase [Symbiobacteriaceae bacterium]